MGSVRKVVQNLGRGELDLSVGGAKGVMNETIYNRLFDVALVQGVIKPRADIHFARQKGILDGRKRDKGRNVADSKLVRDGVAVLDALATRGGDLGTGLDGSVWGSVHGAMVDGSVTGLTKKWSGKLVNVLGVDGGWVSSQHGIEARESLGIIAGIELAFDGSRVGLESDFQRSTDSIEPRATSFRHIPRWKCRFDDGRPIGLSEIIRVDGEIGLEGTFLYYVAQLSVGNGGQGGGSKDRELHDNGGFENGVIE